MSSGKLKVFCLTAPKIFGDKKLTFINIKYKVIIGNILCNKINS